MEASRACGQQCLLAEELHGASRVRVATALISDEADDRRLQLLNGQGLC
jgi:hypothetical protein